MGSRPEKTGCAGPAGPFLPRDSGMVGWSTTARCKHGPAVRPSGNPAVRLLPAPDVADHPGDQEQPVVAGHEAPPVGRVPGDVLLAEAGDAVGWVEDEPEEVLGDPEECGEGEDAQLGAEGGGDEGECVRQVEQDQDEEVEVRVVAGDGAAAEDEAGPAVFEAPGREVAGPAGGALDLDLEQREDGGRGEQREREERVVQRSSPVGVSGAGR